MYKQLIGMSITAPMTNDDSAALKYIWGNLETMMLLHSLSTREQWQLYFLTKKTSGSKQILDFDTSHKLLFT